MDVRGNDAWRAERAVVLGVVALSIAASAWLSIDLTRIRDGVASVWIANGLLVGVALRRPRADWVVLFATAFLANVVPRLLHGDAPLIATGLSVANMIEAFVVAHAVRSRIADIDDAHALLPLSKVATGSSVVACIVSASLATALLAATVHADVLQAWTTWFAAHLLGMVIVATLTVVALRRDTVIFGRPGRRVDFALCVLVLAATCAVVFLQDRYPLLFLAYLPLLLLAFRHGLSGVVAGMLVLGPASVAAGILRAGPFALARDSAVFANALLFQLFIGAAMLLALPVALVLTNSRRLAVLLRDSEARHRLLSEHTRDIVAHLRADGARLYLSRSVRDILGWDAQELIDTGMDLTHPEDRVLRDGTLARVFAEGGHATLLFRARHRDGRYVWIEALVMRVKAARDGELAEVVYSGRDVSIRVAAQQEAARGRERLQSLIDGIPAMVSHVDAERRYTFVNATVARVSGLDVADIVGRDMRDVRGADAYARVAAHVDAALRGEARTYEDGQEINGRRIDYQASYVPDIGPDGSVRGFYSLVTDITALKAAERALEQLARFDALTGLANRRQFEERLQQAVARARRLGLPVALMLLDLDDFKAINDGHGHPAGDAALKAFAERITGCVYDVDLVARLGGDEFAVLVEYADDVRAVAVIARKILAAMEAPIDVGGASVTTSASIGIGFSRAPEYGSALLALADRALYAAKDAGKGTYREFHD